MEKLTKIMPRDILRYSEGIKNAPAAIHEKGYVHGDVSMANIMLNGEGEVRLTDFGGVGKVGESTQE